MVGQLLTNTGVRVRCFTGVVGRQGVQSACANADRVRGLEESSTDRRRCRGT
jgi:hypothetical protein